MSTIAVVFGGPSNEHEISILTGLQCERALTNAGKDTASIYWSLDGKWFHVPAGTEARDYVSGPPADATPIDLVIGGENAGWVTRGRLKRNRLAVERVLNCLHGGAGEAGGFQWMMRLCSLPCTGGTPYAADLGMDKLAFGSILASADIPSLPRILVGPELKPDFDGPFIIKPRFGGSSLGIEVVPDITTAIDLANLGIHYREGAVLEPFRGDLFDLNVAYKTYPEFKTSYIERPTRSGTSQIYGYAEKYLTGEGLAASPRELPAKIPSHLESEIRSLAARVFEATRITGLVRVDFLSDGTTLYVNEVNAIPGAMALYLWDESQDLADLLSDLLTEADHLAQSALVPVAPNGAALRTASGISAKLAGYTQHRSAPGGA